MRGALLAAFLAAAAFALPACKSTVEADEKAREPSALTRMSTGRAKTADISARTRSMSSGRTPMLPPSTQ